MAASAIVFDLDGTIWDSIPWYASLLETATGMPSNRSIAALMAGTSIVKLMNDYGVTRTQFGRLITSGVSSLSLYSTMSETLHTLRSRGVPLAVHTSLPGSIAMPMLETLQLGRYFNSIMHAGNCAARKPSALGIVRALEATGVNPGPSVFYVGDRLVDAQTARNAGVSFAWASYGYVDVAPQYVHARLTQADQILKL